MARDNPEKERELNAKSTKRYHEQSVAREQPRANQRLWQANSKEMAREKKTEKRGGPVFVLISVWPKNIKKNRLGKTEIIVTLTTTMITMMT